MGTPTITRREVYTTFIDRTLRVSEIRNHISKVIAVVRAPSQTITRFLDDPATTPRHAFDFFATSFAYYVFGAALFSLASTGDYSGLEAFFTQVLGMIIFTLGLTALYEFFSRTSDAQRRFSDHMVIYTLILGAAVMVSAIGLVLGAIFAPLGAVISLIAIIWGLVMLILLFSRYWEIPQPTVALYTAGGSILSLVIAVLIGFVLLEVL
jgi:hypothetical protein